MAKILESLIELVSFGLIGSKEDRALSKKIKESYASFRVVGRGTISISAAEVHDDLVQNGAYEKAQALVERGS